MQRQSAIIDNETNASMTVQLALSHGVAAGAALLVVHRPGAFGLSPALIVVLVLACGMGVGLLATANIQYSVFLLHLALVRLVEGRALEKQRLSGLWPLDALFRLLEKVRQRVEEAHKREQLTDEYREQLLRQASEAAAAQERNRLARELHDSIKQQLFSIRMSALAAQAQVRGDVTEAQESLEDIQRSASEAQVEMQALLQQLRSTALENTSLAEAVHTQAQALEYRSGACVSVEIDDLPPADRCPLPMQETIFRIIQEAFANVARHARAQNVWCTVACHEDTLVVIVRDDGQGFDMQRARKGMGLTNVQERARSLDGRVTIESEPGKGTLVRVTIPLLSPREAKGEREREAQTMETRAHAGLQLRSTISVFMMLLTIVAPGLAAVYSVANVRAFTTLVAVFCLLVMLYALVSAHLAIARVAIFRGEEDQETCSLRLEEHRGRAGFLRLLIFGLWYVLAWQPYVSLARTGWQIGLLFLFVEVLATVLLLVEHRLSERAQARYYPLLSRNALTWEVRHRWRQLWWRLLLGLCFGLFLLAIDQHIRLFPPVSFWQWLMYGGFLVFLVLCIGTLIDMWQLQPWRRRAARRTQEQTA